MCLVGKKVIVRTINAGVHYGILKTIDEMTVVLEKSRRIWYLEGAFTLSKVAVSGVKKTSKISIEVPEILLNQVIEVIPCSSEAAECLDHIPAHLEK